MWGKRIPNEADEREASMRTRARNRRIFAIAGAAALAVTMLAAPATATPRAADGEHKITICHYTNSATNPYVIIEVDVAAFDGIGQSDHENHVNKDGLADAEFIDGVCGGEPNS
jgi:ABC-type sugar transport system substrate-binding protein